jgi:AcrR family transcriptional regulator
MVRQKVHDKQQAILDAAVDIFAERGFWDTPTALVSKRAGVADGTLFNYFKTKDELITEVYLEMKHKLAAHLMEGMDAQVGLRAKLRHMWHGYVDWALDNPTKFAVLQQIGASYELSDEVKAAGKEPFMELLALANESIMRGELRDYPVDYLVTLMEAMTIATIQYIATNGLDQVARERVKKVGFDMLWNGATR